MSHIVTAVNQSLKRWIVEEAEEEVSGTYLRLYSSLYRSKNPTDWEGSEEDYGSSEPMDSIAELGGVLDDADGQL